MGVVAFALNARSEPPPFSAVLTCERKSARGRVLCEVELEASRARLVWADAVVLAAPDFAPPLKNRVSQREGKTLSAARIRLPMAFLAKGEGAGKVTVEARAVVCTGPSGAEACTTGTRTETADLVVGPIGP